MKKKGGRGAVAAAGVGLGVAALIVGASAASSAGDSGDGCPTFDDICGNGAGGQCSIDVSCGCPAGTSGGIINSASAAAQSGCTQYEYNCNCP